MTIQQNTIVPSKDQAILNEIKQKYTVQNVASFPVFNPANHEHIADIQNHTPEDAKAAIKSAKAALPAWSGLIATQRARILEKWYALILQNKEALGTLLTREQGKPIAEAIGEVGFGAEFIKWFAEEGKRSYGDVIPTNSQTRRLLVLKQPIGVVAAITPWNFPSAMITRKIAPALAAGCTVIIKPAEETPLSALALKILADQAGIPQGVINIVTTTGAADIADVLTSSSVVRKLSFTGSTRVGKILMEKCAGTIKKLSLELGGNAPFIVFEDADIDAAVAGAILSKFRNAGQTCICANRFLIQSSIQEEFTSKFTAAVQALKIGDGMDINTTVGPLINMEAIKKVETLIAEAQSKGATITLGGRKSTAGNHFFEPTILTNVTRDMDIMHTEIFGPVAPITVFDAEEEAIEIANDTTYGLAAYFWTHDLSRSWRVAEALEYGMVGLNEGAITSEAGPFGGIKESGLGREGSKYGIDDFIELKYVLMGGLS